MLRKRWFRWLIPGLNIKRWLALFSCGVGLLIIGISLMFNYQWLAVLEDIVLAFSYNMTGFYNYNVLIAVGTAVLLIGAVLMLIGTSKVIKRSFVLYYLILIVRCRILFSKIYALIKVLKSLLSAVVQGYQIYYVD